MSALEEAELLASRDFALDVELGSGIIADQYDCEAGANTGRSEQPDFVTQFGEKSVRRIFWPSRVRAVIPGSLSSPKESSMVDDSTGVRERGVVGQGDRGPLFL